MEDILFKLQPLGPNGFIGFDLEFGSGNVELMNLDHFSVP